MQTNVENGDNGADIFVLATSARPQDIDRAMRRPGRLDAEIELTAPSADERADILDCILQSMGVEVRTDDKVNFEGTGSLEESPLTQVELKDAAAAVHGMVGSDLLQVVKEAFLHRASEICPLHEVSLMIASMVLELVISGQTYEPSHPCRL